MFNTLSSLKMLNPAFGGTDPIYTVLNSNFMQRWGYHKYKRLIRFFSLWLPAPCLASLDPPKANRFHQPLLNAMD
jgi:hypothetical protein